MEEAADPFACEIPRLEPHDPIWQGVDTHSSLHASHIFRVCPNRKTSSVTAPSFAIVGLMGFNYRMPQHGRDLGGWHACSLCVRDKLMPS